VIDLDDADSKFVRRFEDLPEGKRSQQLRVKKIEDKKRKVKKFKIIKYLSAKRKQQLDQLDSTLPKVSLRTQTVTPPDLLQYALLGDPSGYTSRRSWLPLIFKRRAIQVHDNAATKIQQLTHDFTTDASKTLKAAGFEKNSSWFIQEGLFDRQTFSRLARQLTMLSTTDEGCHFLASKGTLVYNVIRKCRMHGFDKGTSEKVTVVKISEVVELLNNLTRNMISRGKRIGHGIYNAGLYYASKASILPAIKMYLEIGRRDKYHTFTGFEVAMMNLQSEYTKRISPPTRWAAWKGNVQKREEMLKLITGWDSSEVSFREAIFASNYPKVQRGAYRRYILGIGEMGFRDALWGEWRSRPAFFADSNEELRAQLFAMAFVLAKDQDRALGVLDIWAKRSEYRNPDPDLRAELFSMHYSFHGLKPSAELIRMTKENVPQDPDLALEFFERLLVVDYPKFEPDTRFTLEWATRDEKEGLLVMPLEGQDPIYWKSTETVSRTEIKQPSDEEYPV
jgi:muconolactone delta-isomerase